MLALNPKGGTSSYDRQTSLQGRNPQRVLRSPYSDDDCSDHLRNNSLAELVGWYDRDHTLQPTALPGLHLAGVLPTRQGGASLVRLKTLPWSTQAATTRRGHGLDTSACSANTGRALFFKVKY